ncbi:MAG TPA: hypothetical protein VJN95_04210 [Gemmatimonadales bacterium]|nr:hypothetical protein [Gemmatimonadales bacterium]
MTTLQQLLGRSDPGDDPGCDGAFDVLDQYVEAARRGPVTGIALREFVTHIGNCPGCREDTEGLALAIEALDLQA